MKNLYRRLPGIGRETPDFIIQQKLTRHESGLRAEDVRAIKEVLLRPRRRLAYDRTCRALDLIRATRQRAPELRGPNWNRRIAGEFFESEDGAWGAKEARRDASDSSAREERRSEGMFGLWGSAVVVGIVVIVAVLAEDVRQEHAERSDSGSGNVAQDVEPPEELGSGIESGDSTGDGSAKDLVKTSDICELQERLASEGYYAGPIDGFLGPLTIEALEEFARWSDLTRAKPTTEALTILRRDVPNVSLSATGATRPSTGSLMEAPVDGAGAPLLVRVPRGDNDYYVKMEDLETGKVKSSFYVREGLHWETTLRPGRYKMKYAVGYGWYGVDCYFGAGTEFYQADDVFEFRRDGVNYVGYEVELVRQRGGNLGERALAPDNF